MKRGQIVQKHQSPSWHLLVQSQQWEQQNKTSNLFKVKDKDRSNSDAILVF